LTPERSTDLFIAIDACQDYWLSVKLGVKATSPPQAQRAQRGRRERE
jgi:hypothetical protein